MAEFVEECTQDADYFRSLIDEITTSDHAVIQNILQFIFDELHPNYLAYGEPAVNTKVRGRLRRLSTSREPSAFERMSGRGRRRLSSSSRSQSRSSVRAESASSMHRVDINNIPYGGRIPGFMLPYLEGWHDVEADDNCGFRCVANAFHGGEANWILASRSIRNEVLSDLTYNFVYYDGVSEATCRINWGRGPCGEDH